jgi:hypothetical protein
MPLLILSQELLTLVLVYCLKIYQPQKYFLLISVLTIFDSLGKMKFTLYRKITINYFIPLEVLTIKHQIEEVSRQSPK